MHRPTAARPPSGKGAAFRSFLAGLCLLVGTMSLTLWATTQWMESALFDTDHFVALSGSLIADPTIRSTLTTSVADRLMDNTPKQLENKRTTVEEATSAVLSSPEFAAAWAEILGSFHRQIVDGEGNEAVLNLQPALAPIQEQLKAAGVSPEAVDKLSEGDRLAGVAVLEDQQLEAVRSPIAAARKAASVSIIVTVVALALGILISPRRRRAVIAAGIELAVFAGLGYLTAAVTAQGLKGVIDSPAAAAGWSVVIGGLRTRYFVLIALGAIAAIIAFTAGKIAARR